MTYLAVLNLELLVSFKSLAHKPQKVWVPKANMKTN